MLALPSFAKIQEARLRIIAPDDAQRSTMTLRLGAAAALREIWAGEIVFAPMTRANLAALLAFFEQLDGRYSPFSIPLASGFLTQPNSFSAATLGPAAAGDTGALLSASPVSSTIPAGTLVSVGDIDTDAYQVFEIVTAANVSNLGIVSTTVAPRVRRPIADATPVSFAPVLRVRLREDLPGDPSFNVSHGIMSIQVVEAVYA